MRLILEKQMFKQIKLRHLTFVMFFGIFVAALRFQLAAVTELEER